MSLHKMLKPETQVPANLLVHGFQPHPSDATIIPNSSMIAIILDLGTFPNTNV